MKDRLVLKVGIWAEENRILQTGTKVVAGVSGGADSVCLLHVLKQLAPGMSYSITAVHINHMLRGSESDEDESFVRNLCREWDIPLFVFRENVKALSEKKGISIEEAGRFVRYERFRGVLTETGAQYIAVAHHAWDQAETVFMNLLRGSGTDGLCGMEPVQGNILRPLLFAGRDEIYAYIKRNNLLFRTDSSNFDNSYTRNTVRNIIFPMIKKETGTSVISPLLRTAELLKRDRDYLDKMSLVHYKDIMIAEEKERIIFNRERFQLLHPAITGRVLRIAWKKLTGSIKGLEAKHVEAVIEIAGKKSSGKSVNLPGGIRAVAEYGSLIVTAEKKPENSYFCEKLHIPCREVLIGGKIKVTAIIYSKDEYIKLFGPLRGMGEKSYVQVFDYNKINGGINIRSRLPGDVFFPYGSPGKKKLKEYFIDEKIPSGKRDSIPLLAEDGKIIWVIGHRTGEDYGINENTGTVLYVKITMQDTDEAVNRQRDSKD